MYFYTVKTDGEFGIENYCDIMWATSLDEATEEEIIKAVEENGGIGGAMIRIHRENVDRIFVERIRAYQFFLPLLEDLWWDFKREWLDGMSIKNKLIKYLTKHTYLHADTIYTFLQRVDSKFELQLYVDQVIKARGDK